MNRRRLLLAAALLGASSRRMAWADEPAPQFQIGDAWTYRWSQDGAERGQYVETVVATAEGRVRMLSVGGGGREIVTYDGVEHRYLTRHALSEGDGTGPLGAVIEDESKNDPSIRFPVDVGRSWAVSRRWRNAGTDGDVVTQALRAKVVARATTQTPAGNFETYQVVLEGYWQNESYAGHGGNGRHLETLFYAPEAKRFVRREIVASGPASNKQSAIAIYVRTDELTGISVTPP